MRSIPSFLAMGHAPFREDLRGTRGFRGALFQSVITHYYTFIHTGCKVPWALPRGNAVTAVTSADQGENVCAFSHGQTVCMKLFCANFLMQPVSTDTFSKVRGHRNSPDERECAVSITSVSRSFAVYIRTSNRFYSTCRHSSGMSSCTYVHGESP